VRFRFPPNTPALNLEPRLLRIKDAARYLNATVWFVRSLVWSGFPHLRLGRRILIDRSDLDAYVDRQKEVNNAQIA
jgi:excisionase family DNA binding protein